MRAIRAGGGLACAVCTLVLLASCATSPDARVAGAVAPPRLAVAAAAPVDRSGSVESTATLLPHLEPRVFVLANRVRLRNGVDELEMRLDLIEVARAHALDMASRAYFSHHSPDGEGPGERADRGRIEYRYLGENLARVRNSEDPAGLSMGGWLRSPSHRRILLDERGIGYRYTGVGVARAADGTIYIAQVFIR